MIKKSLKYDYDEFEERVKSLLLDLQIPYKNITQYINSFIHKSILNEKISTFTESNERLEFFWDAILELLITEFLFNKFPDKWEWELTDLRSAIVRWKNLASISASLNFQDYIVLSKGETLTKWNENPYILANTLEAFLWAIYIDLWFEFAKKFVDKYIFSTLSQILENSLHIDPKTNLQEIIQSKQNITPVYKVIEESGLDHNKTYIMWVYVSENKIWEWTGASKKKAEKEAAKNALDNLN